MRALARNKRSFYYCLYTGKTAILDEDNNETGDYLLAYSSHVRMKANISAVKGDSLPELFGSDISYDSVIVTDDMNCPIDENTVLFVDKAPTYDASSSPLYDYIVVKKAKSLNSISYAIKRVK